MARKKKISREVELNVEMKADKSLQKLKALGKGFADIATMSGPQLEKTLEKLEVELEKVGRKLEKATAQADKFGDRSGMLGVGVKHLQQGFNIRTELHSLVKSRISKRSGVGRQQGIGVPLVGQLPFPSQPGQDMPTRRGLGGAMRGDLRSQLGEKLGGLSGKLLGMEGIEEKIKPLEKWIRKIGFEAGNSAQEINKMVDRVKKWAKRLLIAQKILKVVVRATKAFGRALKSAGGRVLRFGSKVIRLRKHFTGLSRQLGRVAMRLRSVGRSFTLAGRDITFQIAGIVGALYQFSSAWAEIEKMQFGVAASMAATGMEWDTAMSKAVDMTTAFRGLAREYGVVGAEASQLGIVIARMGFKGAEGEEVFEAALALSNATMADASISAGALTKIMKQFGVESDQASHFSDVLAMAQNMTGASLADVAAGLSHAAPLAKQYGIAMEEMAAIAVGLTRQGFSATVAFRGLSGTMEKFIEKQTELRGLGIEVENVDGSMQSLRDIMSQLKRVQEQMGDEWAFNTLLTELFDREQAKVIAGMLQLVNTTGEWSDELSGLSREMTETNGYAGEMSDRYLETLAGKMQLVRAEFSAFQIAVGDKAQGALKALMDEIIRFLSNDDIINFIGELVEGIANGLIPAIHDLGNMVESAYYTFKDWMNILGIGSEEIQAIGEVLGGLVGKLMLIGPGLMAAGVALQALGSVGALMAIALNPFVLVLGAIAAGYLLLTGNTEDLEVAWATLADVGGGVYDSLIGIADVAVPGMGTAIDDFVQNTMPDLLDAFLQVAGRTLSLAVDLILPNLDEFMKQLEGLGVDIGIDKLTESINDLFDEMEEGGKTTKKSSDPIKNTFRTLGRILSSGKIGELLGAIAKWLIRIGEVIVRMFGPAVASLVDALVSVFGVVLDILLIADDLWEWIFNITGGMDRWRDAADEVGEKLGVVFRIAGLIAGMLFDFTSKVEGFTDGIEDLSHALFGSGLHEALTQVNNAATILTTTIGFLWDAFSTLAMEDVLGAFSGVETFIQPVVDALTAFVKEIKWIVDNKDIIEEAINATLKPWWTSDSPLPFEYVEMTTKAIKGFNEQLAHMPPGPEGVQQTTGLMQGIIGGVGGGGGAPEITINVSGAAMGDISGKFPEEAFADLVSWIMNATGDVVSV